VAEHVLHLGDCLEVMRTMPDCSVDAVVTDPPYGLSFMGKAWDYDVPGVDVWREVLRVLKPGGHLLAFAGTRTQHRMAVAIEDAGFEIRDMIAWVYGSGFPKSLDVSKAIDKAAGAEREVVGQRIYGDGHVQNSTKLASPIGTFERTQDERLETAPATPEAQQWAGWGTAIKPSFEPVTWARKPLGTVGYCAKMLENLLGLEDQCLQIANAAASSSRLTPAGSPEGKIASAQELAATQHAEDPERKTATGEEAATSSQADTSGSTLVAASIALSIVSLWRHILEGVYARERTSTTSTGSSTTTDWKTLSCCLSQITPESIIQASSLPGGFSANASTAAKALNASLQLLSATHTLSAIEPALWRALGDSQGVGVRPNLDPVVMARKPFPGTVAANVLEHGTGALNVDGCRVGLEVLPGQMAGQAQVGTFERKDMYTPERTGRWPANLIHDGSDEVVGLFPESASSTPSVTATYGTNKDGRENSTYGKGLYSATPNPPPIGDTGSAARFFKQCKGYTEAWPSVTAEPANTVGNCSSQQRQFVASALSDAVTWALQGAVCSSVSLAPSTSATASELRQLCESVITAIQSIGPKFWHESEPARLTLKLSHASFAVHREQTGITTITASHWTSGGSADPVTFSITGTSTAAGDQASAPRAFYTAKASKSDREDGNNHPTVKPTDLMRYLCRLVTPPGGTVLDPFMGSGSTIKGALAEGFNAVGIERDPEYFAIAQKRLNGLNDLMAMLDDLT